MADAGLPDSILPPQPVSAETRRDSLLPVVQSVSEPPEREAGRLAFGEGDKSHRTRAEQEAPWTDLPGVEIVTRTATTQDGKRGWLIVPRDAARRIKGDG